MVQFSREPRGSKRNFESLNYTDFGCDNKAKFFDSQNIKFVLKLKKCKTQGVIFLIAGSLESAC